MALADADMTRARRLKKYWNYFVASWFGNPRAGEWVAWENEHYEKVKHLSDAEIVSLFLYVVYNWSPQLWKEHSKKDYIREPKIGFAAAFHEALLSEAVPPCFEVLMPKEQAEGMTIEAYLANPPWRRPTLDERDMEYMRLPREMWTASLDKVQPPNDVRARKYFSRFEDALREGVGLVITGGPGVGKTSLAAALASEARKLGSTVYFTSLWQLREDLRNQSRFDDLSSVMDRCRDVDVLVLDNLRAEDARGEDWHLSLSAIEALLLYRRDRLRMTFLTSRLVGTEWMDAGLERLTQACVGRLLDFDMEGDDMRAANAESLNQKFLGA